MSEAGMRPAGGGVSAAMKAAQTVLERSGDVRCACKSMHDGKPRGERPEATYVMYNAPCEVSCCVGALICTGHAVCVDCCALIRADLCEWTGSKRDVDLYFVAGSTKRGTS